MDSNSILKSDYLDILFDGRNKNYGGYELRKNYPRRAIRSLMVIFVMGLSIGAYAIISNRKGTVEVKPIAIKTEVILAPPPIDPKKPPPPPPPAEPPPPVKPTVKFTPPVIKKDEEVKEDEKPAEVKELKEAAVGVKTQVGDVNGIDPGIMDKSGMGTDVVEAPPPEIFQYVEQPPEPGYDIKEFTGKNIRYPEMAKENNVQGRVVVRFVVNEDGRVSDVTIVKGIGSGCDEEAKRVVSKFPPWKAGKQNGRAVKVYYTYPISFRLE